MLTSKKSIKPFKIIFMNIWNEYGSGLSCLELNYDFNVQCSKHINIEST